MEAGACTHTGSTAKQARDIGVVLRKALRLLAVGPAKQRRDQGRNATGGCAAVVARFKRNVCATNENIGEGAGHFALDGVRHFRREVRQVVHDTMASAASRVANAHTDGHRLPYASASRSTTAGSCTTCRISSMSVSRDWKLPPGRTA